MPLLRPHCHDFYTFLRLLCEGAHELLSRLITMDKLEPAQVAYWREKTREIVRGMQKVVG